MRMADQDGRQVTEKTVLNCFKKAVYEKEVENEIKSDEEFEQETSNEP